MLSKKQIRLLRKIQHSAPFNISTLPQSVSDDAWYLISEKYVSHHEGVDSNGNHTRQIYCNITPLGKAALSERYRENRHWRIPMIISVIALIKSFLPELIVLMEVLLKQLTQ